MRARSRSRWRHAVRQALPWGAALALGCAGARGPASPSHGRASDVILADEILGASATTAYDLIRRLRPNFLTGRGPTSLIRTKAGTQAPIVYLDQQRLGDEGVLRALPLDGIVEIRYLAAAQAQLRWGSDHPAGAILLLTGTPVRRR